MTAHALALCVCLGAVPGLRALTPAAAQSAPSGAQRYSVSGASAWSAARGQGFTPLPRACATSLDERSQSLLIRQTGTARCRFSLFDGRPLGAGWIIEEKSDQCSHPGLCRLALESGVVPPLTGAIETSAAEASVRPVLQLRTLTLSGPPNADWRDAFRR